MPHNFTRTGAVIEAIHDKVDAIEAGATADQTGGEIKTAYELEADTNAYTDAEKTKLVGVETGADVTSANETSHADVLVDGDIGVNVAAQGHTHGQLHDEAHTVASHSDTTATGPELDELTGGGLTALHSHSGGGGGDMLAATYDPTTVAGDAFDMDNMVEGASTKILTGTERTKLAGIEDSATADQTGGEIKTAYELEADTNAYTDAEKTKLAGVATGADVTSANETSHADVLVDGDIGVNVASQAHTHGQLHDEAHTVASHSDTTATGPELDELTGGGLTALHSHSGGGGGDMLAATYDPTTVAGDAFDMDNMVEGAATKILTGTERTKLAGIEDSATADQTGAEIKVAYEAEADTNAYTDAEKTKLAGVATGADVTSANETSHADVLVDGDIGSTVQAFDADTAKTDTAQEYTATQNFDATTLTDGATISWDLAANQACSVTLAGNRTMAAPTNLKDGATYALKIIQDATGSRTITWNALFKWAGGTAPTLSTGANDVDIIFFYCDGTNLYGSAQLDFS